MWPSGVFSRTEDSTDGALCFDVSSATSSRGLSGATVRSSTSSAGVKMQKESRFVGEICLSQSL